MRPDVERNVRPVLTPLRLGWASMLAASLFWAGIGVLATPVTAPSDTAAAATVTLWIACLGLLCAAAALWLDRVIFAPARITRLLPFPDGALARRHLLAGHLALWSLAEVPALFGLAQLFIDGTLRTHLALCAVSLAILALLMPTRARIAARMEVLLR